MIIWKNSENDINIGKVTCKTKLPLALCGEWADICHFI